MTELQDRIVDALCRHGFPMTVRYLHPEKGTTRYRVERQSFVRRMGRKSEWPAIQKAIDDLVADDIVEVIYPQPGGPSFIRLTE